MCLEKIGVVFCLLWSSFSFAAHSRSEDSEIARPEKTEIKREQGLKLINPLLEGFQVNTTTLRKEEKNILPVEQVKKYLDTFLKKSSDKHHVQFELRDKSLKHKKAKTVTFYGKKIFFWNDLVKTNIKLRARIYTQKQEDGTYKRIDKLSDRFFLELKVKNATPKEYNVSRKYRFLIKDTDLKALLALKISDPKFREKLWSIGYRFKLENPKKTDKQLEIFLETIYQFSLIDEEFIRPLFVVSYSRKGYKHQEQYVRHKRDLKRHPERIEQVEYQVTMDQRIRVFSIDQEAFTKKPINDYLAQNLTKNVIYKYDNDLCFIEYKSPMNSEDPSYRKHSDVHEKITEDFYQPLFQNLNAVGPYKKNKGKLASAMRVLYKIEDEE